MTPATVSMKFHINNIVNRILQSNLNGHKNMIGYIDSSIVSQGNGVYEVLMLMPYCRTHVLGMMNSRYENVIHQTRN